MNVYQDSNYTRTFKIKQKTHKNMNIINKYQQKEEIL